MFLYWLMTVLSTLCMGIFLTLFIQFYFYKKYFSEKGIAIEQNKICAEPLLLPKIFTDLVRSDNISPNDSCMAVNLLLQFLYHELRDTEKVRNWFKKKLSLEFEQLLANSAVGRMIGSIKIREIHLGSEFPILNSINIQNVQINDNHSHIDTLDLKLDLNYCGNFRLVVDVNMLLGKAAYVSITVNELYGEGRLQFCRLPYSHWSFSFYNEPKVQLNVVSQFQGRAYQQITTLISNQIRKILKRKHTLPNFKVRYKPFFDVITCTPKALNISSGYLQLTIHKITRLNDEIANNREIYALVGTDNLPWVEIRNYGSCNFYVLDLSIIKKTHLLGLRFRHDFVENKGEYCLVVDEIKKGGFECDEELFVGDILISIDGKKCTSLNQINKLIKSMPTQFILRVERKISPGKNDEVSTNDMTSTSIDVNSCPIYNSLRRRKGSESESCSSTPSSSLPGSPARRSYFRSSAENIRAPLIAQRDIIHNCDEICHKIMKTKSLLNSQILLYDDVFNFNVTNEERFLNICVRAKKNENQSDKLLGYVNIPLCVLETTSDYLKSFHLKPPSAIPATSFSCYQKLSCQNGFLPSLCYGDITLSLHFTHTSLETITPFIGTIPEITETHLTQSESSDSLRDSVIAMDKKHDFVRTHFTTSTQCDFCGKKIWLKDADRCRECGMSCHKKCVAKCQIETACLPQSLNSKVSDKEPSIEIVAAESINNTAHGAEDSPSQRTFTKPEITTTFVEDCTPQSTPKKGLGGLLANVANRSLKRVGSANNLVPPGGQFPSICSRSLPPSPQQSPAPSRKPSLPTELSDEITSVLETFMEQGSNQGDLMYFAKESGKTLYENLDLVERKEKIHDMINKLKCAINAEVESRFILEKEEQNLKDPNAKAKVAFLIGKKDEKTHALTILMLHFCAGLQHIQDLEEQERDTEASNDSEQKTTFSA